MAWYSTGTLTLVNGSTTVVGVGTDFISGANVGEALYLNDNLYEIGAIVSATQLTLVAPYLGSTDTGVTYKIIPTQSLVADLAAGVSDLITDYSDVKDTAGEGKFNDGTVTAPGITFEGDQNTGIYKIDADNFGLTAGGIKQIDVSSSDVELNHSGNKKLATTSTGVDVTGTLVADGFQFDYGDTLSLTSGATGTDIISTGFVSGQGDFLNITPAGSSSVNNILFKTANASTYADRMKIHSNGNVEFYEDTGTTAKMVWSSSTESLGLNVTSPEGLIHLRGDGTTAGGLVFDSAAQRGYLYQDGTETKFQIGSVSGHWTWTNSGGERMRIDSSGNVGIGTDSPLNIGTGRTVLTLNNSASNFLNFGVSEVRTGGIYSDATKTTILSENPLTFEAGGSTERARIDSSGNFMVDTTSNPVSSSSVKGLWYDATANYLAVSNDNVTAYFNRQGSDGIITQFRKDGSAVGSISANAGTIRVNGTDGTGVYFANSSVFPSGDAGKDLGTSGVRFKDLYLSHHLILGNSNSSTIRSRMTLQRANGNGSGIFATEITGKAQQGMLYAIDESNGNYLIASLSKFNEANSIISNVIDSSGLSIVGTNSGGTIQLSSTASTVKMQVTKHILE